MGRINVLDKHLAELIAAGEVVERPSSVIKELVENSIDAGASAVTVEIKNGGITFMRVTDNGSGIERDDIKLAFLRHSTSKIGKQSDLEAIGTLGFRGEALASICSVSRVELLTRTQGQEFGCRYQIEGGREILLEDAGCPQGTTFVIRDLFYNTPARMKFLKKDISEANAVAAVMDKIALSHPEVSLKFIRDGRQTLLTPGDGKVLSAIYAVYGGDFARGLMAVDYTHQGIHVTGYVSKPFSARANRQMQTFFINGRFVRTKTAAAALEEAYKNSIMVGKFPACVLYLTVPLESVDVNVHPAKVEVRFVNEKPVFESVYYSVKNALMEDASVKEVSIAPPKAPVSYAQPQEPQITMAPVRQMREPLPLYERPVTLPQPAVREPSRPVTVDTVLDEPEAAPASTFAPVKEVLKTPPAPETPVPKSVLEDKKLTILGEAFQTYILIECGEALLLVDKHAAHERILYEKLKAQEKITVQMLLTPVPVTLSKEEYGGFLCNREVFEQAGFLMEEFGDNSVVIRSIPGYLHPSEAQSMAEEILGYVLHNSKLKSEERLDHILHSVACRAAVKGGSDSTMEELKNLVLSLVSHKEVKYCPHGRPVFITLTRRELEKQFGRIQ